MGTSPTYSWPWPDPSNSADGPSAFAALSSAVEATLSGVQVSSYTPTFTGDNGNPTTQSKTGRYRVVNGFCDIAIHIVFGASGGGGLLRVGLPVAASAGVFQQVLPCLLTVATYGGFYIGSGMVGAGSTEIHPHFPTPLTSMAMAWWQNTDSSLAAGTGVPLIPAGWTVLNGDSFTLTGRYQVA